MREREIQSIYSSCTINTSEDNTVHACIRVCFPPACLTLYLRFYFQKKITKGKKRGRPLIYFASCNSVKCEKFGLYVR